MDNFSPLVSVCVITFNSSKTILETLDSVLSQTYPRVELLISDDCSSDNTALICSSWLESHGNHFERVELLMRKSNVGVAANLNTVIGAAKGEWVKTLAGDDILLPDCLKDNMEFVALHENDGIVFSKIREFYNNDKNERVLMDNYIPKPYAIKYYSKSASEQFQQLLLGCFTSTPSVFMKRSLVIENPYLEEYSFCEDWPCWMNLTKNGIALRYFDKVTVLYRVGPSLLHADEKTFVNYNFHQSLIRLFYSERYHIISKTNPDVARQQRNELFLGEVAINLMKNRKNLFTRIILFVFKMIIGTRKVM